MKTLHAFSTSLLLLGAVVVPQSARADTAEATCEVRKEGKNQGGRSGPCTFGQRKGYIDINLRNGETFSLSPGNQANHYRDQKGNTVVRTMEGQDHVYKWEHTKITVRFGGRPAYNSNKHNQPGYNQGGYSQDGAGSEHPWAADGGGSNDPAPPQIMVGGNGEGEVIFNNNCVVYYDKRGRRTSSLPACSSQQVNRAAEAMAAYRREQGMN